MPRYTTPIKDVFLFEEDVRAMFDKVKDQQERLLIAMLWITAARPGELETAKKEDIQFSEDQVNIRLKTLKLKQGEKFSGYPERILSIQRPRGAEMNLYLETIIQHAVNLGPEERLIKYGERWMEKAINNISEKTLGKRITPYHFRHSALTWLGRNYLDAPGLMAFKGARSMAGVIPYIQARPSMIRTELLNRQRSRDLGLAMPTDRPMIARPVKKDEPTLASELKKKEEGSP